MDSNRSVSLQTLLDSLPPEVSVTGDRRVPISAIAIDSREVRPGTLFVALRGAHTDGHRYIGEAIARGAHAVVAEEPFSHRNASSVIVADSAAALSKIAGAFWGNPSTRLCVLGVTGTDGKTTTAYMIAAIANAAGLPCGVLGTVGAHFGSSSWTLEHTTPPAHRVQEILAAMLCAGAKAVAMEVSSHALALHRVEDVEFSVGALTNVTRDHLDFHGSLESYAAAKRRLFTSAQRCVFNADDAHGARWTEELRAIKPVTTFARKAPADVTAEDVALAEDGSSFAVDGIRFRLFLPGGFNVSNALCAVAAARSIGISTADAARGLQSLQRVPGRMELLRSKDVAVIVDYAHTPGALSNVLLAARENARGRVVAVFGCGGDRDRGKRPEMGRVAARCADMLYVTSDNPRTEDPAVIVASILSGIGDAPAVVELDRRKAIEEAITRAQPGDVVVVAGKGHESYQIVGEQTLPFDDLEVAAHALESRTAAVR